MLASTRDGNGYRNVEKLCTARFLSIYFKLVVSGHKLRMQHPQVSEEFVKLRLWSGRHHLGPTLNHVTLLRTCVRLYTAPKHLQLCMQVHKWLTAQYKIAAIISRRFSWIVVMLRSGIVVLTSTTNATIIINITTVNYQFRQMVVHHDVAKCMLMVGIFDTP